MSDRDRIDDWLNAEVEPLTPRPGAFERISRRAHRRKVTRAAMSAAGVAVVIGAAVAAPGIVSALRGTTSRPAPPVAQGTPRPSARPTVTGQGTGGVSSQSSKPVPQPTRPASLQTPGPVPKNFQPTSVTFIGPHTGAVIGQASTPGHCATRDCTSLAVTTDYGQTWGGVSAPRTGPPDGPSGVGQLRFLNQQDGWAFGPQLWVTHDGGARWKQVETGGKRVTDLETADGNAFALFATCTGGGAAFGAQCTSFSLYSSAAGSDTWQPVPGPTRGLVPAAAGQPGSASLVIGPGRGYLLAPSGQLFSGPLTGAPWTMVDPLGPCAPGPPGPGGQPAGALLAAAGPSQLAMVCAAGTSPAGDTQVKQAYVSSDGGASWTQRAQIPAAGIAASLAAQGSLIVLATDAGIYRSADGGTTWQQAQAGPGGTPPGFGYVGMTSPSNGVALPADPHLHEVLVTTDGGSTWHAYQVSSP
jgi:hypothetical protein